MSSDNGTKSSNALAARRRGRPRKWHFSWLIGDSILSYIASGGTLAAACRTAGVPSIFTGARWRREQPDFEAAIKEARDERAGSAAVVVVGRALGEGYNLALAKRRDLPFLKWLAGYKVPVPFGDWPTRKIGQRRKEIRASQDPAAQWMEEQLDESRREMADNIRRDS